jgi:hypothetical protein
MNHKLTLICMIPWRLKLALQELSERNGTNVSDEVCQALINYAAHKEINLHKYEEPFSQGGCVRGRKPYMRNKIAAQITEMLAGKSMLTSEINEAIKGHSVRSIRSVLVYLERADRIYRTRENGRIRCHLPGA